MKRISISFYDDIHEKLEQRMKENGSASVAQCVRELVDLGLKIEAASKENNHKNDENNLLLEIKNLLKNGLSWQLETRFLARHIVEKQALNSNENAAETLEKYKARSVDYIQGMYQDTVD